MSRAALALLLAAGLFFCLLRVMDPVRLPRWLKSG